MLERISTSDALEEARVAGDIAGVLEAVARGVCFWGVTLKRGMSDLFADSDDGRFERRLSCGHPLVRPMFLVEPFPGAPDAFDMIEFELGAERANAFRQRVEKLEQQKQEFAQAVVDLARRWDESPNVGAWANLDEHRSWLRDQAFECGRYLESLAGLVRARSGSGTASTRDSNKSTPALSTAPTIGGETTEGHLLTRWRKLNAMERAIAVALLEKGCLSASASHLPSQETLSRWAGYKWDSAFKSALSSLVKSGLLDNARHHGRRGGYLLTSEGARAAEHFRIADGLD